MYGYSPRYYGISDEDAVAPPDIQTWLDQRALITESACQHLLRAKQRMKNQADKRRIERSFDVGEQVFLKLQPYVQSSVVRRASQKLAFRFFGPYTILQKIGSVAYRLALPDSSKVHPVFHVSQLKKFLAPTQQVQPVLPEPGDNFRVPSQVLDRRVVSRGADTIAQVLEIGRAHV